MQIQSTTCAALIAAAFACASPTADASTASAAPQAASPTVSEARATFYRRAFPEAASFTGKPIPKEMLPEVDRSNDSYVEARSKNGELLGYLRDFSGPVSTSDRCQCEPLNLTLALNPDLTLRTILSAAPLRKKNKALMSEADMARLIDIARNPPERLSKLRFVDGVVDATSGATRPQYKPHVVADAALSTQRLVLLVEQTQRVLQGAPLLRDQARLDQLIRDNREPLKRSHALAEFLDLAESREVTAQAFWQLVHGAASVAGSGTDSAIEAAILRHGRALGEDELAKACYVLLDEGRVLKLAERCLTELGHATSPQVSRLRGTILFFNRKPADAASELSSAAETIGINDDPVMHLRLVDALGTSGKREPACARARLVYAAHPLLDGALDSLQICGDAKAIAAKVQAAEKSRLLAGRRDGNTPAPTLPVEGPNYQSLDLDLAAEKKITVVVFFSTWCPHCGRELPRLEEFWRDVQSGKQRDRVRVVGIRTGVERDTEPYEAFIKKQPIDFPVWTDATLSLAFGKFTKALDLPPMLPTVVVVDATGAVRFVLEPGDYRDTAQELHWAVDALSGP